MIFSRRWKSSSSVGPRSPDPQAVVGVIHRDTGGCGEVVTTLCPGRSHGVARCTRGNHPSARRRSGSFGGGGHQEHLSGQVERTETPAPRSACWGTQVLPLLDVGKPLIPLGVRVPPRRELVPLDAPSKPVGSAPWGGGI